MGVHDLSKTSYIKGLQCLRYLYLYKHHYPLRDKLSAQKLAKFRRGTDVGSMARDLFPGGVNLAPASFRKYEAAVQKTADCIKIGENVLYEPAFVHDGVLIFLDILVRTPEGWHALEVKSSASLSETYFNDASLQYYVLKGSGVDLCRFSLVHINPSYIRSGDPVPESLFTIRDVTPEVEARQESVRQQVSLQRETLKKKEIPHADTGPHCYKPYDCDFLGYCWKGSQNQDNILTLEMLDDAQKENLWQQGVRTVTALGKCNSCTVDDAVRIYASCVAERKEHINKDALKEVLHLPDTTTLFLDIFSYNPAVPLIDGCSPYDLMPCVLSASAVNGDSSLFCTPDADSMKEMLLYLGALAKGHDTVIVYDKNVFHEVILTAEKATGLTIENSNLCGLKDIFDNAYYSSYRLSGSTAFEDVLTALSLKNPYPPKDKPSNPFDAAHLYEKSLYSKDPDEKESLKSTLLAYGTDNLRYLKRLSSFIEKKIK